MAMMEGFAAADEIALARVRQIERVPRSVRQVDDDLTALEQMEDEHDGTEGQQADVDDVAEQPVERAADVGGQRRDENRHTEAEDEHHDQGDHVDSEHGGEGTVPVGSDQILVGRLVRRRHLGRRAEFAEDAGDLVLRRGGAEAAFERIEQRGPEFARDVRPAAPRQAARNVGDVAIDQSHCESPF
jgi:hypothetical protein